MSRAPFNPEALESVTAIVRHLASDDAAAAFRSLLLMVGEGDAAGSFDLSELGRRAGFGTDATEVAGRLERAETVLTQSCGLRLANIDTKGGPFSRCTQAARFDRFCIPDLLRAILDSPFSTPCETQAVPVVDASTDVWLATVRAAAGGGGRHFVLRCDARGDRETVDVAGLLARLGATAVDDLPVLVAGGSLPEVLLRAELHAGERSAIVIVASSLLLEIGRGPDDFYEDAPQPNADVLSLTPHAASALGTLPHLRCTYLWRAPADGAVPRELDGLVAGCIGPLRYNGAWSASLVASMAPGIGARGTQAILSELDDPRLAGAIVAAVKACGSIGGIDLDDAAGFVARSFGSRPGGLSWQVEAGVFDPRLLVADHDGQMLLDRARHLARNGARVLLQGPAGGGKTTFALALARSMASAYGSAAERPVITITPAAILRRSWGATERLLDRIWTEAAARNAIVWADELDSLCGARNPSETGGNAHLVRSLTDQFLRALDAFSGVPFIAAVNDLETIDPSVRRRFDFVVAVGDDMPADRERLAWASLVGTEPPVGWRPVGASVSDVALAVRRCRMLGLDDATSIADAIFRARAARVGTKLSKAARRSVH